MTTNEEKSEHSWPKAISKGVDLVKELSPFFRRILGETFENLGGSLSDWSAYFRYINLLRIRDKVEAIHQARALEGHTIPIPPRYAVQIIDNASVEDDNSVQDLWAGLIANATDPESKINLQKVYIETLSALEPIDAILLKLLSLDANMTNYNDTFSGKKLNALAIANHVDEDVDKILISLHNLNKHGCILDSWEQNLDRLDYGYSGFRVNNPDSDFRLSHFGRQLMKACKSS